MITTHSVDHGTFTIERTYPATPERVFVAWADRDTKAAWFAHDPDFFETSGDYSLDFRVGGHELLDGTLHNGRSFRYDAYFQDIVDGRRIVASYDVSIDGQRTSVSLMTVELRPAAEGTRLVMTEQGAFFDGLDSNDQRQEGASDMLDKLGEHLQATG
jgi:uncharacterized protein YndB with AHSA1/START domain